MVLSRTAAQRPSAAGTADPVVISVTRPEAGTDAELAEALRLAVREWAADAAHYFGPAAADDAAYHLATHRIAPLTHTVTIRRDDLLAWLHFTASR